MKWTHGLRARWRLLFRRAAEDRMEEELRFHVEMETEKYVREGMTAGEARRRAALAFGGAEGHKEAMRDGRSLAWAGGLMLDLKLANRMIFKHPGLTLVAIFALAIGIPVGLLPLHVLDSLSRPLPVEAGEEIVVVRNYDQAESRPVARPLHDYGQWREELSSFEDLGMWRRDQYNVNSEDERAAPVQGAEVTASVFSLLQIPPLLGRSLTEADEVVGAPDVVVIGYDLWQARLAGDPNIVGSTIRIGAVPHTVVGVMPEGFLFPVRDHLWLPFRYDPLAYQPGEGPTALVMGRLADGVSIEEARNEIEVWGQGMANQFPDTHAQFQLQVRPYARVITDTETDDPQARAVVLFIESFALLLLALACGNVGILVLARVATRSRELAIRTALGASRIRIVSQLFIESLVLALLGAGVGLLILQAVATGTDHLWHLPYWIDFQVSLKTAVLAMSLAVVSAAIASVGPALKATGKHVQASMQEASGSGIRFGKGYSVLIVAEVAVALWFLAIGSSLLPSAISKPGGIGEVGIQTDQYLFAALRIPQVDRATSGVHSDSVFIGRVAVAHRELVRRLSAEPGPGAVAIASALPGMEHSSRWMQVEGVPQAPDAPAPAYKVNVGKVDVGYFDALDQPILSGRDFNSADLGEDRSAVIVNTSFVDRVLGGRNPLGRRLRYWSPGQESEPWLFEIVGVVPRLGTSSLNPDEDQGLYHVAAPGELHPVTFAVRVGNDPEQFAPRLRSIVGEIDASAVLQNPVALNEVPNVNRRLLMAGTYLVALLAGIAIVLAAACLYALMSFTVAKRTRECAIRTALGAQHANIVSAIGKRVFLQLSIGVLIGAFLSAGVLWAYDDHLASGSPLRTANWPLTVGLVTLFVTVVGVLACVKPVLGMLRIRPVEVLKG